VHGSASLQDAHREIAFFFPEHVGMEGVTSEEPLNDFDLAPWELTVGTAPWLRTATRPAPPAAATAGLSLEDLSEEDLALLPEGEREAVRRAAATARRRDVAAAPEEPADKDDEYEDPDEL